MRARELRRAVYDRQEGRCAVTGALLGEVDGDSWHMHHRRPGGMGGTRRPGQQSLANVVGLLARVHNFGDPCLLLDGVAGRSVHGDPSWSAPLGLLVSPSVDDPGSVPCRIEGRGFVFLLPDGRYLPVR